MKIRLLFALLVAVLIPSVARAQAEDPYVTEARGVVLGFCQAFLAGDADTAIAYLDQNDPEYQGYVRLIPYLTSMSHAETQLFDAVDAHFGAAEGETLRSSDGISALPYGIVHGIDNLQFAIVDDGARAFLQLPMEEGEEPMNIMMLNRVGSTWRIDAGESLGLEMPTNEQGWNAWNTNTRLFLTHMNALRQELPNISTTEEFNQRFLEHDEAMRQESGTALDEGE